MKVHVDRRLCEGNGLCEFYAPAVFSVADDGTVSYSPDVPPEQVEAVEIAEQMCPQRAVLIER
jgi:ferredoxin